MGSGTCGGSSFEDVYLSEESPGCHTVAGTEVLLAVHRGHPDTEGEGYKLEVGVN